MSQGKFCEISPFRSVPRANAVLLLYRTNVLIILSLISVINGVLTWVGRGFGIHHLTLQLILGYIGYPVTFFLGL